jgi:hypothetical protein
LAWDRDEPICVKLPVSAFSMFEDVRIIAIAHIGMISRDFYQLEDTARFVYRCLKWLFSTDTQTAILLLSIPSLFLTDLETCLKSQQFNIAFGDFDTDLDDYRVILISSDLDMSNSEWRAKLQTWLARGGGLMCLHVPSRLDEEIEAAVNPLLAEYGLAFSICRLLTRRGNRVQCDVPATVNEATHWEFSFFVNAFSNLLREEGDVPDAGLDEIVTSLRYHMIVADDRYADFFRTLWRDSYNFLNATSYATDKGLCPLLSQSIVMLLLRELRRRMPASAFVMLPEAVSFPGFSEDLTEETFSCDIALSPQRWISTGLWLQPGKVGTVECAGVSEGMKIQIGAHCSDMLERQGPWPRWPFAVTSWQLDEGATKVASETGGIVYLVVHDVQTTDEASCVFRGFAQHPRYSLVDPDVWETSRSSTAPWAELETPSLTVTIPTATLRKIPDLRVCCRRLEALAKSVVSFMNYEIIRPYRVVFDIDACLADTNANRGYPIMLPLSLIDDIILPTDLPTTHLFHFIHCLAVVSIREGVLDELTERAIGTLITMAVLQTVFPGFDPGTLPDFSNPPLLFRELWFIHTQINKKLLPKMLEDLQKPDAASHASPEDMWIEFVTALSFLAECDMASIFEKVRPLPVSVKTMLKELPEPPRHR